MREPSTRDPVQRCAFGLVRLASYGAPARRRASWRREWEAELAHGFRSGAAFRTLRRALLSFADALHVRMQMRSAASVDGRHVASTEQGHISSAGERRMSSPSDRHENCTAGLIADGRLAARVIQRDPWFAVLVFMTFGLGIGVNASVFAVADAVLFRELSLAEPERLVAVEPEPGASVSKAVLTALRERTGSFESLAGWSGAGFLWTDPQEDALLAGARGTADVFAVLGVPALHGRTLVTGDDAPGAPLVVVVSHAFWRARLGGSEDALGSTLRLNDVPHTVVGVMPATFEFPDGRAQLWTPLEMDAAAEQDWQSGYLLVVGRLRAGVDATAATADVRGALTALRADSPGSFAPQYGDAAIVERLQQTLNVAPRAPLLALLAAAFAVFLTACVNVGALLLARATDREAELAVRAALGGSRTRIARLLLVESLVFAVGGAIVGLLLAHQGVGIARALLPENIAGASRIALDTRVVAVATLCAALAGIAFGLAPALRGARVSPGRALMPRAATTSASRRRTLSTFIVVETALAVLLVACAGMALRNLSRVLSQPTGFDARGVVTAAVMPMPPRYGSPVSLRTYWRTVFEALDSAPSIRSAGGIHLLPFGGGDWRPELIVEGATLAPGERRPEVSWRVATPGWFDAAGVDLRRGRRFLDSDRDGTLAVGIASESLARIVRPDGDALGSRVRTFVEGGDTWVEIVGVVEDARMVGLDRPPAPVLYRPAAQMPMSPLYVFARGPDDARTTSELRRVLARIDDDVPVFDVRSFGDVVGSNVAGERLVARLLLTFGALALLLGAVGVYSVTAFAVARRTAELGVRSALGADARTLLAMVLAESVRDAGFGVAVGVALTLAAGRVAASRLPGIEVSDPFALAGAALVLALTAVLAAAVPAWRAARVDPARTLRRG